jgi:hypothetical protein
MISLLDRGSTLDFLVLSSENAVAIGEKLESSAVDLTILPTIPPEPRDLRRFARPDLARTPD